MTHRKEERYLVTLTKNELRMLRLGRRVNSKVRMIRRIAVFLAKTFINYTKNHYMAIFYRLLALICAYVMARCAIASSPFDAENLLPDPLLFTACIIGTAMMLILVFIKTETLEEMVNLSTPHDYDGE